jgi:putative methyltransferase (TIGR04325 family)
VLWDLLVRLKHANTPPEWEYLPKGWAYAQRHPDNQAWNDPSILEVYRRKWPVFERLVAGSGPLGIAHESDLTTDSDLLSHNLVLTFGYVLGLAAQGRSAVSMLDWGGGIGHYCLLARALLPGVALEYHCKDMPLLASAGMELLPEGHFYSDESCLNRYYDLVMASTSLHYSQAWQATLAGLSGATGRYLYLASTPIVLDAPSFVFVQRPRSFGYRTEYLAWCLNRQDLLAGVEGLGLRPGARVRLRPRAAHRERAGTKLVPRLSVCPHWLGRRPAKVGSGSLIRKMI